MTWGNPPRNYLHLGPKPWRVKQGFNSCHGGGAQETFITRMPFPLFIRDAFTIHSRSPRSRWDLKEDTNWSRWSVCHRGGEETPIPGIATHHTSPAGGGGSWLGGNKKRLDWGRGLKGRPSRADRHRERQQLSNWQVGCHWGSWTGSEA